jgi:hypothetical protein
MSFSDAFTQLSESVQSLLLALTLSGSLSLYEIHLNAFPHEIGYAAPLALGEFRERAMLLWLQKDLRSIVGTHRSPPRYALYTYTCVCVN